MGERLTTSESNKRKTYTRRAVLAGAAAYVAGLTYAAGKGAVELGKTIDKNLTSSPKPYPYRGFREGQQVGQIEIYTTNGNGDANIRFKPQLTTEKGDDTKRGKAKIGTIINGAIIVPGEGSSAIDWAQFDCNKANPPITNDKGTPESLSDDAQCFVVGEFIRDVSEK